LRVSKTPRDEFDGGLANRCVLHRWAARNPGRGLGIDPAFHYCPARPYDRDGRPRDAGRANGDFRGFHALPACEGASNRLLLWPDVEPARPATAAPGQQRS